VCEYESPALRFWELKPEAEMVCGAESEFVHFTVPPALIVTVAGLNAKFFMFTEMVCGAPPEGGGLLVGGGVCVPPEGGGACVPPYDAQPLAKIKASPNRSKTITCLGPGFIQNTP